MLCIDWSRILNSLFSNRFDTLNALVTRCLGCSLLGLFWLLLFRFRNNRIHRISISKERSYMFQIWKRNLRWPENYCICAYDGAGGCIGFPTKNFPKNAYSVYPSKLHSFHSVHSAIGSRMNGMIFCSFRKQNSSQKNTNTSLFRVFLFRNSPKRTWCGK